MANLYITSNNKKEGKTFVTAGLAATMQSLGYVTSVYKPIQTGGIDIKGFTQSPDLTVIKSIDPYINTHFSYLFKSKNEPIISAEKENLQIDIDYIHNEFAKLAAASDCTVIDGDCGILSPLAQSAQNIDLVKRVQAPLLIVVTPEENTINNTLLTINSAQEKGVEVRGVVINNIKEDCSKELLTSMTRIIEEYSNVSILGLIPYLGESFKPEELITSILNGVDIESVFKLRIEKLDLN